MKSSNKRYKNLFTGRWEVLRLYYYVHNHGWRLAKKYECNGYIWEFGQAQEYVFPSGNILYVGKLKELRQDCDMIETDYGYFTRDKRLHIERPAIKSDGWDCLNDRYRVEKINKTDYWIYDLKDVVNEPEDYRIKMKIRKID